MCLLYFRGEQSPTNKGSGKDMIEVRECKKCGTRYDGNKYSSICPRCAEEATIEELPVKKASAIRKIFFNFLGLIAGAVAIEIVLIIAEWLFLNVIGSISFIVEWLSWPVDYSTYALSTMIIAEAVIGMWLCATISRVGKAKYNYGCFILGIYRIVMWVISIIGMISEYGFNFDIVWTILITLIIYGYVTFSSGANSEDGL